MTKESFKKLSKEEQLNLTWSPAERTCYTLELQASSLPEVKMETSGIYSEQDAIKAYAPIRAFCQCNENVLPAIKKIVTSESTRFTIGVFFDGTNLPKDKVLVVFLPIDTELENVQPIFFKKNNMRDSKVIYNEKSRYVAENIACGLLIE